MIPLAISIVIPTALGFLGEERRPENLGGVQWDVFQRHPYLVCLDKPYTSQNPHLPRHYTSLNNLPT